VRRFVDRGAVTAAYVGIGMAVTIGISFLLIIPIEPIVWLLALPSGLVIGYYANQRSDRRAGPWSRILANGLFAGLVTGVAAALLLLGVKALFFYADNGYRDQSAGGPISCTAGADCVYQRYRLIDDGARIPQLEAAGVTDAATFTSFYWAEQFQVAGLIVLVTATGGLGGAAAYGATRPRASGTGPSSAAADPREAGAAQ
jgi:hypothetical protein